MRRAPLIRVLSLIFLPLWVACSSDRGNSEDAGAATISGGISSGADAGSADAGDATASDGSAGDGSDGGELLDVGMGGTATDTGEDTEGCRGVDFLFVIDNSGSMADEQDNLVGSFPDFMDEIQLALADNAQDFHIMVVDTDDEPDLCVGVCEMFPSGYCNGLPCSDFPSDACAAVMGAGRVTSNALGNEGGTCGITSGGRYIDSSQPDIYGTFQCLGYTGTTGSGAERQMEALQGAISEPLLAPGACNEGFLRDDAVLVITLITDEEDDPTDPQGGSSGTPTSWRTAVMAAKDDRPNSVVVLGLVGDTGQPGAICEPLGSDDIEGAEESPRLREFVEGFGSAGLLGSVCADSYAGFFGEAVDLIDTTCDNYVPPE